MFRFAEPQYLYGLLLLPVCLLLLVWTEMQVRKRLRRFGDPALLIPLTPGLSRTRERVKYAFMLVAIGLTMVMLARPQYGTHVDTTTRRGIEVVIALDVSNSMLATDVSPNRLERAKLAISKLVDELQGDRIGLIIFAGESFVQLPITSDYRMAKAFARRIDPSLVSEQGTAIGKALEQALLSFSGDTEQNHGRVIILITDGENHEGGAEEAAAEAAKTGRAVYVLGIGSPEGAPIPTRDGYMQDRNGETVVTKLNEDMCRQVAAAGKGTYIHVDNSSVAQEKLQAALSGLSQKEMSTPVYSEYDEQFQAVALLLFLVLVAELFVSACENPFFKKFKLFRR